MPKQEDRLSASAYAVSDEEMALATGGNALLEGDICPLCGEPLNAGCYEAKHICLTVTPSPGPAPGPAPRPTPTPKPRPTPGPTPRPSGR